MKESRYTLLLQEGIRRALTPAEVAELERLSPPGRDGHTIEEEMALNLALRDLPPVPLSSNFTARVLQATEAERAREQRKQPFWPWRAPSWAWPRHFAAGLAFLLILFFGYQEHQFHERTQFVQGVALLRQAAELPDLQVLRDFRIIQTLPSGPASDAELLAALQ